MVGCGISGDLSTLLPCTGCTLYHMCSLVPRCACAFNATLRRCMYTSGGLFSCVCGTNRDLFLGRRMEGTGRSDAFPVLVLKHSVLCLAHECVCGVGLCCTAEADQALPGSDYRCLDLAEGTCSAHLSIWLVGSVLHNPIFVQIINPPAMYLQAYVQSLSNTAVASACDPAAFAARLNLCCLLLHPSMRRPLSVAQVGSKWR